MQPKIFILQEEAALLESEIDILSQSLDKVEEQLDSLEKDSNRDPNKIAHVKLLHEKNRENHNEVKRKRAVQIVKVQNSRLLLNQITRENRADKLLITLGILSMLLGFNLWYFLLQSPQDKLLKHELQKATLATDKLSIRGQTPNP